MIVRTVELPIEGSPEECMARFCDAASAGHVPDIAVLPELFTTGYVLDRISELSIEPDSLADLPLSQVASGCGMWLVGGTLPVRYPGGVVNTMPVYSPDGSLVYSTGKVHLFRQMGEDRAFLPGSCGGVFDLSGITSGGIVCYDLRFPELSRRLALEGAEIIFAPAEWPNRRRSLFRSLLRARAAEAQIFVVGCNLGGEHLGVSFMGGGGVAHPTGNMVNGTLVAPGVTEYEVLPGDVGLMRSKLNCLEDRRPEEYFADGS